MKNKLEIVIRHLEENNSETCDCALCHSQESKTFLHGLRYALSLIPKRRK